MKSNYNYNCFEMGCVNSNINKKTTADKTIHK